MNRRVSVIMPAFNVSRFIAEAIESILDQTFTDFVFLIVEGGSDDGTKEIIGSYGDERIVMRELPVRQFPSPAHWAVQARNVGIAATECPFLACMDADDVSFSRRFECQLNIFEKHPEIVALGTGFDFMTENGTIGMRRHDGQIHRSVKRRFEMKIPDIPHGSLMSRKEALEKTGGYRLEFPVAQDLDLLLRLAEVGIVATIDLPLYLSRVNRSSLSYSGSWRQDSYGLAARIFSKERLRFGSDRLQRGNFKLVIPPGGKRYEKWRRSQKNSLIAIIEGRRRDSIWFALKAIFFRPQRPGGWRLLLESLQRSR